MLLMNMNKNNIVHHFKIFNQYLLSFLLVFTGLNLDEHAHHFDGGYGICNQGCDSAEHHSMHNECEDCINNSGKQKFFINVHNNLIIIAQVSPTRIMLAHLLRAQATVLVVQGLHLPTYKIKYHFS